ncbi:poly polymerase 2 ADP-ribosyltransferase 2 [Didymella exigua CBS 183.55]|uniref:Poly [ADP-ribose] polymerase n=1 Tax=Didymella exigua CBS 183.55 TaxID=1150837 RepID=A0A6A5R503_9PLEO|nr:poly polymerase 2 ADP-ribosyltransferase 2 [Didymella exigua CBS 183.55]KAF1923195.1 poly polymerase 2 ADP-ribosyltransferase 2 [Didymella exigua CBS 183.55]
MPPRRAASKQKAQASPLDGCSVATSGRFSGTSQGALQKRVTDLGGSVASKITADTNILITTDKDFEAKSAKIAAAIDNDVPIVTIDWLDETESSNARADEKQYLLNTLAASTVASAPITNGKKRAASGSANGTPVLSQGASQKKRKTLEDKAKVDNVKVGDGQNVQSKKIHVEVDEHCQAPHYEVYIDDDGLIWDASLNQTNASANNNKFYKVQLLQSPNGAHFQTWTRWGRVGERGQMKMLGNGSLADAFKNFETKFKDKSGLKWEDRGADPKNGKYAYVEKNYNPDSDDEDDDEVEIHKAGGSCTKSDQPPVDSKLTKPVQNLVELIFNLNYQEEALSAMNYDNKKMPLGKLSKGTIGRGFQALKELAALIDNPTTSAEIEQVSNRYYSVIPHVFGRDRPTIINNNKLLKEEIELLESLSDMKEASDMLKASRKDDSNLNELDRQFQTLGMDEMEPLSVKGSEFAELSDYLLKTKGATHNVNYAVQDIFRIQRKGEFERFQNSPFAKVSGNRRLLWHGSRVTNFAGILGQGLRIAPPEAPATGYMFGKGIYLADMSSKSANYCNHFQSGGTALLLLCEAELGNPVHELIDASFSAGEDAKAKGMCSTWGKGKVGPSQWKDAGCVHPSLAGTLMPDVSVIPGGTNVKGAYLQYNEYIAYDVTQVRLRYLLRVRM